MFSLMVNVLAATTEISLTIEPLTRCKWLITKYIENEVMQDEEKFRNLLKNVLPGLEVVQKRSLFGILLQNKSSAKVYYNNNE